MNINTKKHIKATKRYPKRSNIRIQMDGVVWITFDDDTNGRIIISGLDDLDNLRGSVYIGVGLAGSFARVAASIQNVPCVTIAPIIEVHTVYPWLPDEDKEFYMKVFGSTDAMIKFQHLQETIRPKEVVYGDDSVHLDTLPNVVCEWSSDDISESIERFSQRGP